METVNFKGHKLEYKRTFRALVEYERLFGKPADEIKGFTEIMNLMHTIVSTQAKKQGVEFNLTVDEFIDWLDANPDALEGFNFDKEEAKTKEDKEKKS
jgi:hypothetical protein